MENVFEITLLLDFYGQLLTKRQYEILDMYYNNDFSLAEISENLNISRQGVYDNIRRGKQTLEKYESRLLLIKRFKEQKNRAENVLGLLKEIKSECLDEEDKRKLSLIEEGITGIINGL